MRLLGLTIACLSTAACGSLAGPEYAGEPLISLRGVAASDSRESWRDVHAAAFWQAVDPVQSQTTRLPIYNEFPTFWLDVIAQPPHAMLFHVDTGEPLIAEAYLHIIRADRDPDPVAGDIVATDYEHALIYVGGELVPGGPTARYLGGALSPGFHIAESVSTSAPTLAQAPLVERCAAIAGDTPAIRARCIAARSYQLQPAPSDLDTVLQFYVNAP